MATIEYAKGSSICTEGELLDNAYVITAGNVKATFPGGEIALKKGDVIGLCDIAYDSHFFSYSALDNVTVVTLPLKPKNMLKESIKTNPEIARMTFSSMLNQVILVYKHYSVMKKKCADLYATVNTFYDSYAKTCNLNGITPRSLPQFDSLSELSLENDLDDWIVGFYVALAGFTPEVKQSMAMNPSYLLGFINKSSQDIHNAFAACEEMDEYEASQTDILINENEMDIFDLYTSLVFRLPPDSIDNLSTKESIDKLIEMVKGFKNCDSLMVHERISAYRTKLQSFSSSATTEEDNNRNTESYQRELLNSIDTILSYANLTEEESSTFKALINSYKKLNDKASSDEGPRKLRLEITSYFNKIYAKAFLKSTTDYSIPTIVKMFFKFGYVDEELAGLDNAAYLYTLADTYEGDETFGVYTLYDWLKAIYDCKKDPSRNEFDTDFVTYAHEQKVSGKITAEEETQLLNNAIERLNYELNNMFPTVNKVTYGRITSFCPVFSEHNLIKPLPSCLVSVDDIIVSLQQINKIDYGAFYRETVYSCPEAGINKEFIQVKILPDIILFPNVGTRGVMWQEIEGRKRTTPARFMLSIFHLEDLTNTFVRLVGEFRWEMCKRVQGSRWNDVSDRSLTSEYFDYIQFYKKNSELSADAKEKIKTSLSKAKNSFKEMFIRDYIIWVLYEGNGSPRLNKLVRQMMATYCPFPKELRTKLAANPLFKETLEHYEIKVAQKLHHCDNVMAKLRNANVDAPNELLLHINFIEGK
ncbi:MAG: hypothetical protein MJ123_10320 [Lachnospiraceae bacterium]|nr:hypothetical protein [Lachnospiraceae bacterium]